MLSGYASRIHKRYGKKRVKLGFENVIGDVELIGDIHVTAGATVATTTAAAAAVVVAGWCLLH